ncbi:Pyrimidine deaminase archaeal predicted [Methanosarcina horonobensis HB-1 = JCM 15518]|uniref:Pyrimidine deaminase archaeal predicted n=1 Tax=Methanosarcina horonobensis HB-1 = JCM 15518 TaxID=1434110 RepID=A0A0E3WSP1_9EURY|nr:amidohydrolase family protein [Methanosarcina horonobensis]AKB77060.1 Pyrimidine deaminase archaeal predicted [Methanosarcina horonobensis HB-1 = JCM 15518]
MYGTEQVISGTIIAGPELIPIEGYICVRNGIITEVGEECTRSKNIIAPCFVNAHTHLGDSVCKDPLLGKTSGFRIQRDLDSLVKPPDGLKHRILRETSYKILVEHIRRSLLDMIETGTCAFADFREGGLVGVAALNKALEGLELHSLIFGRPTEPQLPLEVVLAEVRRILLHSDGLGISGANDLEMELLQGITACTRDRKKLFAIHAGEKDRSDIENALSLEPDLLIHLTQATEKDLNEVAQAEIPVVVCPRSNFVTGVGMAPIAEMLETGIRVAAGTDNVMLNSVNMFAEMEFMSKVFSIDDRQVFKICTLNGSFVMGPDSASSIEKGNKANLMILNGSSNNLAGIQDPVGGITKRARPDDILAVLHS